MNQTGILGFPIANRVKKLWDVWNIRAFILFSLSLQTFLILSAPFRKRTSKKWVVMSIWSGYLLADWAASFSVGLISNIQGDTSGHKDNGELLSFWAPFLLLHLGGPDTITAFALEDNELWLRHLLGLLFQVIATAYVFAQSLYENKLWVPTILMFLAGIIKYAERTRALYLASLNSFRESMLKEPDPGPNYAKLMEEYSSKMEAKLPTRIDMIPEPDIESKAANDEDKKEKELEELEELEVVQHAFHFFKIFKGLIVDLIFSFRERNDSREFFSKRSAKDAFRVIEVELNFIYEVLYTKVAVVHCKIGYFFRFISFGSVVGALSLFYIQEKHSFHKFDVRVTYTLLLGAIALDTIALLMLIFSDRTVASLKKSEKKSLAAIILNQVLIFKRSRSNKGLALTTKRFLFRRWSESVSTFNLIDYCLKEREERIGKVLSFKYFLYRIKKLNGKVIAYLGIKEFLDEIRYVSSERFSEELKKFIFAELKKKSEIADDSETAREICSARGDWVLRDSARVEGHKDCIKSLLHWIDDVTYDESLLLWHIATELCYNNEDGNGNSSNSPVSAGQKTGNRELCKILSDYMLYLLVIQPTMMSAVAGIGQIRFRDTCAEAKKFFSRGDLEEEQKQPKKQKQGGEQKREQGEEQKQEQGRRDLEQVEEQKQEQVEEQKQGQGEPVKKVNRKQEKKQKQIHIQKQACKKILAVNTVVEPVTVKGDRSKSVLFDACRLSKALEKLKEKKWAIMSKVWLELLSYGASHCRANTHAQLLSKGGELSSFVWLLMAHLGLGEQFQIKEGHARAKLIVGK